MVLICYVRRTSLRPDKKYFVFPLDCLEKFGVGRSKEKVFFGKIISAFQLQWTRRSLSRNSQAEYASQADERRGHLAASLD